MAIFDATLIQGIAHFEKVTKAHVKDAFTDQNDKLTFIVEQGELGKAIGKQANTLKKLETQFGKKLRVAEFNPDKQQFIQNLCAPLKITDIEETPEGIIILKGKDHKTNGLLIGRNAKNLRNLEWMTRRQFEVPEIKVI